MIARLRGTVAARTAAGLVLDVGGVGYLLAVTPRVSARVGQEATVETYLHVREDAMQLYGFASLDEKELFELLLGVSGVSADMREVLAAASAGNERAKLALDIYAHRIRQTIGAMTATLGGVDVLVFTAGVGEHAAAIRAGLADRLAFLAVELDADANSHGDGDREITRAGAGVRSAVVVAREDVEMARQARALLRS